MSEAKHTPLPWAVQQIRGGYQIWDIGGNELIAVLTGDCINAELICQAVNSHNALVEALEKALELAKAIPHLELVWKEWEQALAKAKGEL